MKCSDAISRAILVRLVFSCSLVLLLVGVAPAGNFGQLAAQMHAAKSPDAAIELLKQNRAASGDPDIGMVLKEATSASNEADVASRLEAMVELRAMAEGTSSGTDNQAAGAGTSVRAIKASGFYRDAGVAEGSNWLGKALERLKNLRLNPREPNLDTPNLGLSGLGKIVIPLLWCLLGLAVGWFAYLAFRHIELKKVRRHRASVLDAEEPDRSLDEWLAAADRLTAEGNYREAVRALYLACLLRFDEYRVARFDRHETNWEHLRRIHLSAKCPPALDFSPPTKAFDRIWYGKEIDGLADVQRFRDWYAQYVGILAEGK